MALRYSEKSHAFIQERMWGKIRTYNEVVEFLSSCKSYEYSVESLKRMKLLDKSCGLLLSKINTILVGGNTGKSTTVHCTSKLLKHEGFKVGALYSSHFLTFNERLTLNGQPIVNKRFAEVVNTVINKALQEKVQASAHELMLMAGFL